MSKKHSNNGSTFTDATYKRKRLLAVVCPTQTRAAREQDARVAARSRASLKRVREIGLYETLRELGASFPKIEVKPFKRRI